jgi:hypothetical protein
MPDVRPPILVLEHGDVNIFPTLSRAESHVEAIDVIAGEYEFFDSLAHRLRANVDGNRVQLELVIPVDEQEKYLAGVLRTYFARIPQAISIDPAEALGLSLHQLVARRMELESQGRHDKGNR